MRNTRSLDYLGAGAKQSIPTVSRLSLILHANAANKRDEKRLFSGKLVDDGFWEKVRMPLYVLHGFDRLDSHLARLPNMVGESLALLARHAQLPMIRRERERAKTLST